MYPLQALVTNRFREKQVVVIVCGGNWMDTPTNTPTKYCIHVLIHEILRGMDIPWFPSPRYTPEKVSYCKVIVWLPHYSVVKLIIALWLQLALSQAFLCCNRAVNYPIQIQILCFVFYYSLMLCSLTKEVGVRPRYDKLLEHPLIKDYDEKEVDVGAWLRDVDKTVGL